MRILALGALMLAAQADAQRMNVEPRAGLIVVRTTVFKPGTYDLRADTASSRPLIRVRGSDITLDFTDVVLQGSAPTEDPDQAQGVAILVEGGENVTIKGARVRGYKIAIMARDTRNLRLIDNDLSFNWKPRLYSIVEHESIADWLSFHQNEKREWLRFGAGIYLEDVKGGELRGNTVHQGMNGLLLTRTDSLLVANNDFSFNSGLGIGLYRSDHNRILHNKVDYNVRGYSHGFYRRGQDSAGLLIYQQSDSNIVAYNSVTHGGDGLFLWAGQHTMDTGQGGANDNVFYANDFSYAPTNGMEATFSRNVFLRNRVVGNDHGLWGGYSFSSIVAGNHFEANRVGIAIEHGQDNRIEGNSFTGDSTAIYLWANRIEPGDWGYPKHRDTRSRDYDIARNTITRARVAFRVSQTNPLRGRDNVVSADSVVVSRDTSFVASAIGTTTGSIDLSLGDLVRRYAVRALPDSQPVGSAAASLPRSAIIVDEWGPYDWKSPKLWPADSSLATPLRLRVLGPAGMAWRLQGVQGATISKDRGVVGDSIVVTPAAGAVEDWTVTLEAHGPATRTPRGLERGPNHPYVFTYSRFDAKPVWDVRVYAWNDSTHPLKAGPAFQALLRGERGAAALTRSEQRLDYVWYRPRIQGWPVDKYGVVATTTLTLPAGSYALRTISDDGIRVFVDGALVHEDWSVHESRVKEVPLAAGRHAIRIEYFQGDGWAELQAVVIKDGRNGGR